MLINKLDLVDLVYKKSNGIIEKKHISTIIDIFSDYLISEFKEDRIISINKFGTFSLKYLDNLKIIKFIPHYAFKRIVKIKY